jgi:hypothetical protein
MAGAAFAKKRTHFARKFDLNLRTKLLKCYTWNIACMVLKHGQFERRSEIPRKF